MRTKLERELRFLFDELKSQGLPTEGLFLGKAADNSTPFIMFDTTGNPRIRMIVTPKGTRLEFLDTNGKILRVIVPDG